MWGRLRVTHTQRGRGEEIRPDGGGGAQKKAPNTWGTGEAIWDETPAQTTLRTASPPLRGFQEGSTDQAS